MNLPENAALLRIFIGESDRYEGHALYERIVLTAREMKLAGATVLRSPMGFGASSRMHTEKVLRLSEDLPMVIEIVDTEEKLMALVEAIEPMMQGGLITLEKVTVIRYDATSSAN